MKFLDNLVCKIMKNPTVEKAVEKKGIGFAVEFLTRLVAQKPVFWKVIQGAGFIVFVWNNLPLWLAQNGIPVPEIITTWENRTAGIIGIVVAITSQLATQSKVVGVNDTTGAPIKQTDVNTMPFTAATEVKNIPVSGKQVDIALNK